MEWNDRGIVLAVRRHGESGAIAELLTRSHGRHLGLVRGATSLRHRSSLQPGNTLSVTWRARLADHLGTYSAEVLTARAAALIEDPLALSAVQAFAVLGHLLPEREPARALHDALEVTLDAMTDDGLWIPLMVRWELGLLEELGFGLDLSACAVTGSPDDLEYVSPKSGRAVSRGAGAAYHDRLLRLPGFLSGRRGEPGLSEILDGFRLTGHFLDRHVFLPRGIAPPSARSRLIDALAARARRAGRDGPLSPPIPHAIDEP